MKRVRGRGETTPGRPDLIGVPRPRHEPSRAFTAGRPRVPSCRPFLLRHTALCTSGLTPSRLRRPGKVRPALSGPSLLA